MKRILMVLLCALFLTGCQSGAHSIPKDSHIVTDCSGREVYVPNEVDSVACLYAYIGHASVLLGQEQKLSSIVNGLKRDHLMREKLTDIDELPVPYNDRAINIEELMTSDPDLILLRQDSLENEGEKQKLEKTHVPYVVIDYDTMEEQMHSIEVLGQTLGCEERAQDYLATYDRILSMVSERVETIPEAKQLKVYHSVNEVVRTDVPGSISDEILQAAGLVNVIYDGGDLDTEGSKVYASVEQIYLWDPQWILCNEPAAVEYFETDEKLAGLKAVRDGHVLQLPVGISRWCHPGSIETPLAVLYLGKTLYPDYFADVDLDAEVKTFYQEYIDITLSDEELNLIYSGQGMRDEKEKGGNNT